MRKKGFLVFELLVSFTFTFVVIVFILQAIFVFQDKQINEMNRRNLSNAKIRIYQEMDEDLGNFEEFTAVQKITVAPETINFVSTKSYPLRVVHDSVKKIDSIYWNGNLIPLDKSIKVTSINVKTNDPIMTLTITFKQNKKTDTLIFVRETKIPSTNVTLNY